MSAWIVSKKHIDALVTWAIDNDLVVMYHGRHYKVSDNPNRIGKILWGENYRSVNHRYSENSIMPRYEFTANRLAKNINLVIFKNIECYDYQSCECNDYPESFAKAFVMATEETLKKIGYTYKRVKDLKEFDDAPWGIN